MTKEKTYFEPKVHKPNGGQKGAKEQIMLQSPPPIAISISEREREGKSKSVETFIKSSPTTMPCFKLEITCTLCKAINILCNMSFMKMRPILS